MAIECIEECSAFVGKLPRGCQFCREGSKMVLLVTGRCRTGCFYCPLSRGKKGKDLMYANERVVGRNEHIIEEARLMRAEGTGITGGDPLWDLDLTVSIIELLRNELGPLHHIHLYTSTIDPEAFRRLEDAGLDELRVHPPLPLWDLMEKTQMERAVARSGLDIGFEVPCIPGERARLLALVRFADRLGLDFVNLNELEFSETNCDALLERGFEVKGDISSAVLGSEELGLDILSMDIGVQRHYCSSAFKDGVQLRRRIMRRAESVALPLDLITEDGTLYKGVIEPSGPETVPMLIGEFGVPPELLRFDQDKGRVEIASWVLEDIAEELDLPAYLVEEYPTADRLEVEREPLNDPARIRPR